MLRLKTFFPQLLLIVAVGLLVPNCQAQTEKESTKTIRPKLQIINGCQSTVDVFWLKPDGERVPNGTIDAGKQTIITTTLSHRFAIVRRDDKSETIVTSEVPVQAYRVGGLPNFYTQQLFASGFPVVASSQVNPYALKEAVYIIDKMLAQRPDVRDAMIKSGARLSVLAHNEFTTDQPEWVWLADEPVPEFPDIEPRDYRDARARGMGGSQTDPYCSCAEENLLAFEGDPYSTENILIHELAHNIHLRGMSNVDPTFDSRVKVAFRAAMSDGLWKGKYASVNHHEYFAEGVQSWFDDNRENDHDHNHVNTRAELLEYDPRLAELCREVFGDTEFRYTKPTTRLTEHLEGYDPTQSPRFVWPARLESAKIRIRAAAQARSNSANPKKDDQTSKQPNSTTTTANTKPTLPNILLILADDLGYGDLGCYNTQAKVPTPNLDRMAADGLRFTDAHSPSTVCTPTRYSLMTGQMAFRIPGGNTVFTGVGGPSLIAADRLTMPAMLKQQGYATAAVGKWHIGWTFRDATGNPIHDGGLDAVQRVDFTRRIEGGPTDCGFDQFVGTACCPTTDWLYTFIQDDRIPTPPVKVIDKSMLPKHPYANDCRSGLIAPDFPMEEIDLVFLEKSREFLREHLKRTPNKPFFLYHAMQAVHLPSFPAKAFQGKSEAGPHGDFILEMDHIIGELLNELEQLGVADNTLVIFSSDNGPETTSVIQMRADHEHDGARPWRGMKRDNWEGGHRVPMIVRWPKQVKAGSQSDQLVCLTDIMATLAAVTGAELPDYAAEDSFNLLPALQGITEPIRPYMLTQAFGGSRTLSIRRGSWKYIDHVKSGGNNYESKLLKPFARADAADDTPQLYDLAVDPGETNNLYTKRPDIATELKSLLEETKSSGRSRL